MRLVYNYDLRCGHENWTRNYLSHHPILRGDYINIDFANYIVYKVVHGLKYVVLYVRQEN